MTRRAATAVAHPNIALSKYWGKASGEGNRPAVPSLSVTLAGMATRTTVRFDERLLQDRLVLDGREATEGETGRVRALLDRLCPRGRDRAEVVSANDFPTAAGLASSASGFAALAVAADAASDAGLSRARLSELARQSSASAARSLFGGFVELPAGRGTEGVEGPAACPVAEPEHWDLCLVVAVVTERPKSVGSTEGMGHTARSSPLYESWLRCAPALHARVRHAVLQRDWEALGPAIEQSALTMHAVALAADPALLYWTGTTVQVIAEVRRMRADGLCAYLTIDAGPHVKVLCPPEQRDEIRRRLERVEGVIRSIAARPGGGARVIEADCDEELRA